GHGQAAVRHLSVQERRVRAHRLARVQTKRCGPSEWWAAPHYESLRSAVTGSPPFGRNELPPEPGLARREAHRRAATSEPARHPPAPLRPDLRAGWRGGGLRGHEGVPRDLVAQSHKRVFARGDRSAPP